MAQSKTALKVEIMSTTGHNNLSNNTIIQQQRSITGSMKISIIESFPTHLYVKVKRLLDFLIF